MKRIALMTLALATIVGTANADPVVADRAASKFNLFTASLVVVDRTELPTLGGNSSFGTAINANGDVVGYSFTLSQMHAFLWSRSTGTMTDLIPAGDTVQAFGISDDGTVVGSSVDDFSGNRRAFKWKAGTKTDLDPLPDPLLGHDESIAHGVNNLGQVAGASGKNGMFSAVIWQDNGTPTDLRTALGSGFSVARAINDAGQVAGVYMTASGQMHGFLWTPDGSSGVVTDLGTLVGGSFSAAWAINAEGKVTGNSSAETGFHSFLWWSSDTQMLALDEFMSIGLGINSTPHVVGWSMPSMQPQDAILWGPSGLRLDLGTLGGAETDAAVAQGINGTGQVAGFSTNSSGDRRATVWTVQDAGTPPPPSTECTTPQEKIVCLRNQIASFEGDGLLNRGQARSLYAKLDAAEKQLGRQNSRAADNVLRALTHHVHGIMHAAILETQGPAFVAEVNALRDKIKQ